MWTTGTVRAVREQPNSVKRTVRNSSHELCINMLVLPVRVSLVQVACYRLYDPSRFFLSKNKACAVMKCERAADHLHILPFSVK